MRVSVAVMVVAGLGWLGITGVSSASKKCAPDNPAICWTLQTEAETLEDALKEIALLNSKLYAAEMAMEYAANSRIRCEEQIKLLAGAVPTPPKPE